MFRHLASRLAATFAAATLLLAAACDDPSRLPTTPAPLARAVITPNSACQADSARALTRAIDELFSTAQLRNAARDSLRKVTSRCTSSRPQTYPSPDGAAQSLASAPFAAVSYSEWLLGRRRTNGFVASDPALWSYVVRLFRYVGYTLPTSSLVLTDEGFAHVCVAGNACNPRAGDGRSGVLFPAGALSDQVGVKFLVTGHPVSCDATTSFGSTPSYRTLGSCREITADPKVGTSVALKKLAIVELCTRPGTPDFLMRSTKDPYAENGSLVQGKLAQRTLWAPGDQSPISFRPPALGAIADEACGFPAPPAGLLPSAFRQLGTALAELFLPEKAHASHGGLGSLGGSTGFMSVFGPLDGFGFNATFDRDAVGSFPGDAVTTRGSWTLTGADPSSATVTYGSGLFASQYLEFNQAGGNAGAKGDVTLTGRLAEPMVTSTEDTTRSIRVRWRAAVLSSRVGTTALVLRPADAKQPALVRVGYRDGSSAQSGTFSFVLPNGTRTRDFTWRKNAVDRFDVAIHLRASGKATVSIRLLDRPMPEVPVATYDVNAASFAEFAWVTTNRDIQVIGSDDYQAFDETDDLPVAP